MAKKVNMVKGKKKNLFNFWPLFHFLLVAKHQKVLVCIQFYSFAQRHVYLDFRKKLVFLNSELQSQSSFAWFSLDAFETIKHPLFLQVVVPFQILFISLWAFSISILNNSTSLRDLGHHVICLPPEPVSPSSS